MYLATEPPPRCSPLLDTSIECKMTETRVAGVDTVIIEAPWVRAVITCERFDSKEDELRACRPLKGGLGWKDAKAHPWRGHIDLRCTDGVAWSPVVPGETRAQTWAILKQMVQTRIIELRVERLRYNDRLEHAWQLSVEAGVPLPYSSSQPRMRLATTESEALVVSQTRLRPVLVPNEDVR